LLQENGDYKTLKIVDFGLAEVLVLDSDRTCGVCGSLGFIAPEVYQHERYGREIDMFSFGVILFLMMSGEKPFGDNSTVLVQKTLQVSRDPSGQYFHRYRRLRRRSCPHIRLFSCMFKLAYQVNQGIWTTVSQDAKNLVSKLLAFREERLDAAQALAHEWFQIADDSHSLAPPRYGKSYRLLDVVSTRCSVFANILEPVAMSSAKLTMSPPLPSSSRKRLLSYRIKYQRDRTLENAAASGSILRSTRHWSSLFLLLVGSCTMELLFPIQNLILVLVFL
jgi:serine/threonine protein kinase